MYRTCLFCHAALGSNESVEVFPVGRRLAFDGARGRLWVVCGKCARWNLSPLEERWEAVESCERLFRGTRLRASTEQIGLARLKEGVELIRIGEPQRPELAAWRYGSQFERRRRRQVLTLTAAVAVGVPLVATGAYSALLALPGVGVAMHAASWLPLFLERRRVVARTTRDHGEPVVIRRTHADTAGIRRNEGGDHPWCLEIELGHEVPLWLHGDEATRVLSRVMAVMNYSGGSGRAVQSAVQCLDEAGSPDRWFSSVAALSEQRYTGVQLVRTLPTPMRLALEMATHEEEERRALEGELAALEAAWKEAEEIAAISDSLLLPESVEGFLRRQRPRPSEG